MELFKVNHKMNLHYEWLCACSIRVVVIFALMFYGELMHFTDKLGFIVQHYYSTYYMLTLCLMTYVLGSKLCQHNRLLSIYIPKREMFM